MSCGAILKVHTFISSVRSEKLQYFVDFALKAQAYDICKGILKTATLDIAHQAQVSHGNVFAHFPTRDDLVLAVVEEFAQALNQQFQQLSKDSLLEFLRGHLAVIHQYEDFYARLIVEIPLLPTAIRQHLFVLQSGIAHYFREAYLKDANIAKSHQLPLSFLFNTWMGLLHYYLTHRELFAPHASLIATKGEELAVQFIQLINH